MREERGYLLSFVKYGDNDAVMHLYTAEGSYKSFFLRGIYSRRNKKKVYLQPLNEISLQVSPKNLGNSLLQVSNFELKANSNPSEKVKVSAILFFVSDLLNITLRKETVSPQFYNEIAQLIFKVNQGNMKAHFLFCFSLIKYLGVSPSISNDKYLNPETGNFETNMVHKLFDAEISELWKTYLTVGDATNLRLNKANSAGLLDSLLLYLQYHFEGFRNPVSLDIVREIFE